MTYEKDVLERLDQISNKVSWFRAPDLSGIFILLVIIAMNTCAISTSTDKLESYFSVEKCNESINETKHDY